MARTTYPASAKQVDWIERMVVEKGITKEDMAVRTGHAFENLTTKTAGTWLDILFSAPKPKSANDPTEAGLYEKADGTVVKMVWNKEGSRMYGKQLEHGRGFVYVAGCASGVTASMLMTPEQARAYGIRTSHCVNCGEELEAGVSMQIGLGTTCGPRIMGKDEYRAAVREAKIALGLPVRGQAKAAPAVPVGELGNPVFVSQDETPMAHNGRVLGAPAGFSGGPSDAQVEDLLAYFS